MIELDLSDPRVAAALVAAVDRRVDARLEALLPRYAYGTVESVNTTAKTVGVYLFGSATASPSVRYPDWCQPVVGQRVRVVLRPGGDRYVDEVYGAPLLAGTAVGIVIRKTDTHSIVSGTWTKVVAYTNTDRAGVGMTWNAYGGHEIRADVAGLYVVAVHAVFTANAVGAIRAIGIGTANGASPGGTPTATDKWTANAPTASAGGIECSRIMAVSVNDTFAVCVYQDSGAALNVQNVILSATRIGV